MISDGIMGIQVIDNEPQLRIEPHIQEITKEDLFYVYKTVLKSKPIQLPIGDFFYRECENGGCGFIGVVHKKQHFCPLCYHLMSTIEKDINEGFDDRFQLWQKEKRLMEKIINGDIQSYVKDMNEKIGKNLDLRTHDDLMDSVMGEEVEVDES